MPKDGRFTPSRERGLGLVNQGVVTRIESGMYLFLDDERGGFHWQCFTAQI
jgi:hypothetical protein